MRHVKLVTAPLVFVAITILLTATTTPASAADVTVGSQGHFKTIQQAVDAAKPGDTILIAPGTYTENVAVNKQLTIAAASGRPTVQAADASKDVFLVSSPGVRIQGLALVGGASGVQLQQTSDCVVTSVVAQNNVRGVYLAHSTNNEISSNDLTGNGYGVYADNSSHNTISSNTAKDEKGNGVTLGDGIFLNACDANTITNNDLSENHVFGISLYSSRHNAISNNTMSNNDLVGIRLGPGSNDNTVTFNTLTGNGHSAQSGAETFPPSGILIVSATDNKIYLNDFVNQPSALVGASTTVLNSPEQMAYTFNGAQHTGYMSNYYSDYKGNDSNGTGIGSTPSAYGDKYPLLKPLANYGTIVPASAVTPTPTPAASTTATSGNQSAGGARIPGFEVLTAIAALAIAGLILLGSRYRSR